MATAVFVTSTRSPVSSRYFVAGHPPSCSTAPARHGDASSPRPPPRRSAGPNRPAIVDALLTLPSQMDAARLHGRARRAPGRHHRRRYHAASRTSSGSGPRLQSRETSDRRPRRARSSPPTVDDDIAPLLSGSKEVPTTMASRSRPSRRSCQCPGAPRHWLDPARPQPGSALGHDPRCFRGLQQRDRARLPGKRNDPAHARAPGRGAADCDRGRRDVAASAGRPDARAGHDDHGKGRWTRSASSPGETGTRVDLELRLPGSRVASFAPRTPA